MPGPVGHALAGVAAAWTADLVPGRRGWRTAGPSASFFARAGGGLTLLCAALGALPDLDLVLSRHRSITHSVGAILVVSILAIGVTGWVTRKVQSSKFKVQSVARVTLMCAAAYGSHLLLDWLGVDTRMPYGLQALWPFSDHWYISGLDLFPQTERREFFSPAALRINLFATAYEAAVMLPVLAALWLVRVKALARLATEKAPGHHPPQ